MGTILILIYGQEGVRRMYRSLWQGDGCPAEVARCRTRRLVGRRDRFGPRAAQLLVASVLPNATQYALFSFHSHKSVNTKNITSNILTHA